MSAATTAKAIPYAAAMDEFSSNRLDHVASTSKNRKILAAVLHAQNACTPDAPSHHIRDNRVVATIVHRAIANNWTDVLISAAGSRHMTQRDYADIISAHKIFAEDVYLAILGSKAAESAALMSMLQNATRYPAVKEAAREVRVSLVRSRINAINADPEAYALDADEEQPEVSRAVTIALALGRHDLVNELVATGCTGSFTADYLLAA